MLGGWRLRAGLSTRSRGVSCEDLLFSDMIGLEVVVVVVRLGRIDGLVCRGVVGVDSSLIDK